MKKKSKLEFLGGAITIIGLLLSAVEHWLDEKEIERLIDEKLRDRLDKR